METSRTTYFKRNILYSYITTIVTSLLAFACRTVFVYKLGADYLGVSGLFNNVLGILSFSELGIGTAINYSLYKPIADGDNEKIKSLMRLYKNAYRIIALIVTSAGLIIFPFLGFLVNTEIPMEEIRVFYLIFLFNTVSSYFVSYKTSYVSALQKHYVVTNIHAIANVAINILQIVALMLGAKYLIYLLIASGVGLLQKVLCAVYINHKYPVLVEKDVQPLDSETKHGIRRNVGALVMHKIGDVAVNQTDNIIVSVFISTAMVGLLSNYITILNIILMMTNVLFSGNIASVGNLVAKESKERQKAVFDTYDFLSFWVYGFVMIAFITLSQPFVTLWLGEKMLIDDFTMILFFASKYLEGLCRVTYSFKAAGGRFNEDKWVPFAQAVVNIVVSIAAVKLIGLPGVFVGTIAQRLIVNYMRPHVVYKYVLESPEKEYFIRFFARIILLTLVCAGLWGVSRFVLSEVTVLRFVIMTVITAVIPNLIIILIYRKTPMYADLKSRIFKKRKKEGN